MANSLLTSVSGLRANQQVLDVVGNNLANANTPGFKSQRVRFSDLLYQTLAQATSSAEGSAGSGINPVQVGFGVRSSSIDTLLAQGSLQTTGNNLDLSIQGAGFFVVKNGNQERYTRSGAFLVDSLNYLVDPTTGFRVQRFGTIGEGSSAAPAFQTTGVNDIRIPFGTGLPGQATAKITLQGNLSANATGPRATTLTSAAPFAETAGPATATTLLNDLTDNTADYGGTDMLRLRGVAADGTTVDVNIPVGAATTLGDVVTAINANFPGTTASVDATGNLVVQATATGSSKLSVTIADVAGNAGATNWLGHDLALTTTGKDGDQVTTAIQVFDTQGTAHNVSIVFTKQGDNLWDLAATIPTSEGTVVDGQVQGLTFNEDGSFRQVTGTGLGDGFLTFQFNGVATPQVVSFDFGRANGFNGLTQFGGNSTAAATVQDGFGAGSLTSLTIGADGVVNGVFSNGKTLPLAQLSVALFGNPGALNREGNNYFSLSSQSGLALVGAAQSAGRGAITQGTLELSNVDVAQEFTTLIQAQRGFQISARAITVSDQVLQELAGIIR